MKLFPWHMTFAAFVILASPFTVPAAERIGSSNEGLWDKEQTFAQIHTRCLQVWHCVPKQDVLHGEDTEIRTTAPKSTFGTCNAGGGAIDSCNVCAASKPTEKCEWWLEKK